MSRPNSATPAPKALSRASTAASHLRPSPCTVFPPQCPHNRVGTASTFGQPGAQLSGLLFLSTAILARLSKPQSLPAGSCLRSRRLTPPGWPFPFALIGHSFVNVSVPHRMHLSIGARAPEFTRLYAWVACLNFAVHSARSSSNSEFSPPIRRRTAHRLHAGAGLSRFCCVIHAPFVQLRVFPSTVEKDSPQSPAGAGLSRFRGLHCAPRLTPGGPVRLAGGPACRAPALQLKLTQAGAGRPTQQTPSSLSVCSDLFVIVFIHVCLFVSSSLICHVHLRVCAHAHPYMHTLTCSLLLFYHCRCQCHPLQHQ